ncbi:MAG TPA: head-tail connector protein [Clostridia bacterium]|nr:head-tail connector protein [Clostridia bacterium]
MILTLDEAKDYCHVDHDKDDPYITGLIGMADKYLRAAIGEAYVETDERAKELARLCVSDCYFNRSTQGAKAEGTINRLVNDFMLQLKLGG